MTTGKKNLSSLIKKYKCFDDVPGPLRLPVIGSLWKYFPTIGNYTFKRLHVTSKLRRAEFGDTVRERLGATEILSIYNVEDVEKVFKEDGKFPRRKSHSALAKYRNENPERYNNAGLLAANGEEWWRIRSELQKPLAKISCIRSYLPQMNEVVEDFTAKLGKSEKLEDLLSRLSLEIVGVVFLDVRFGCLSETSRDRTDMIIAAAFSSLDCVMKTELSFPWWQWFPTKTYKQLCEAQDFLYDVAVELVSKKEAELKAKRADEQSMSVLEDYLCNPRLDRKDVASMISDALFAGIDTTAFSTSFLLYLVATHPRVQEKLFEESKRVLPEKSSPLRAESLSMIPYTRAVVKESMRLFPISIGIGRLAHEDGSTTLSGVEIPANTVLVTQNFDMSRQKENFSEPLEFRPERFLKGNAEKCNPFVSLPFGHGPRACIGRRLAEQELYLILLKMVRKYEISWPSSEKMDCITRLINAPDVPLTFKFDGREMPESSVAIHDVWFLKPTRGCVVKCVSADDSSDRVAVVRASGNVEIWRAASNPYHEITLHPDLTREELAPKPNEVAEEYEWVTAVLWCRGRLFAIGTHGFLFELLLDRFHCVGHFVGVGFGIPTCFATNGFEIVAGTHNGHTVLLTLTENAPTIERNLAELGSCRVTCVALWQKVVVASMSNASIAVIHLETRRVTWLSKPVPRQSVDAVVFYDRNTVVSGHSDGKVVMWNLNTMSILHSFESFRAGVTCLSVVPSKMVFASGVDPVIQCFSPSDRSGPAAKQRRIRSQEAASDAIMRNSYAPPSWIATLGLKFHGRHVTSLSSSRSWTVSGSANGELFFFRAPNSSWLQEHIQNFPALPDESEICLLRSIRCLLANSDGNLMVWPLDAVDFEENMGTGIGMDVLVPERLQRTSIAFPKGRERKTGGVSGIAALEDGSVIVRLVGGHPNFYSWEGPTNPTNAKKMAIDEESIEIFPSQRIFSFRGGFLSVTDVGGVQLISCDDGKITASPFFDVLRLKDEGLSNTLCTAAAVAETSCTAAINSVDGRTYVVNPVTQQIVFKVPRIQIPITALAFNPLTSNLLAAFANRSILEFGSQCEKDNNLMTEWSNSWVPPEWWKLRPGPAVRKVVPSGEKALICDGDTIFLLSQDISSHQFADIPWNGREMSVDVFPVRAIVIVAVLACAIAFLIVFLVFRALRGRSGFQRTVKANLADFGATRSTRRCHLVDNDSDNELYEGESSLNGGLSAETKRKIDVAVFDAESCSWDQDAAMLMPLCIDLLNFSLGLRRPRRRRRFFLGQIELVQIDGLAVLKIIKHCHEETSGTLDVAQGVLLGLVVDNKLEITNSFPFPRHPDETMDEEDYQLEMMRNLRKINIDHFHVGWYQSTQQGNFLSPTVLESQFTYQMAIAESVVLIYDPAKTSRGFLSLRAFKLSPEAVKLYKEEDFSPEKVKNLQLSFEHLLKEIRVVIKNSHLVNALLLELQEAIPPTEKPCDYLDLGTTGVLEKHLRNMMDCVDELAQEVNKYNLYQRQVMKQFQMKQQFIQRRTVENEARVARGEAALPEDDVNKQFKPIPSPSRKEALITSGQVLSYCDQISQFSSQALGKWFLSECLQEARSKAN
ncbi:unnamed protein product [Notodromas monacha]|uniref:Eukaryotic translation initiation factor 3 subunit H n=1 Tax=Notodromas monacha TaxID=399045 RepID=A0A7R9BFQ9_9CRUS|nr:unnamed protein product [Notodromas monacha]CAG0914606.1 unnamed protein product [Notodromas monacha]